MAEGSAGKQQCTQQKDKRWSDLQQQNNQKCNKRTSAIKFTTRDGRQTETAPNEDTPEIENQTILLAPIIHDTVGLDPQLLSQGMKKEAQQMKHQAVFTETGGNALTPEQQANFIDPRWVLKRARIVAKGYTTWRRPRLTLASAPLFCILRVLLTLVHNWSVCAGDASLLQLGNETAARCRKMSC